MNTSELKRKVTSLKKWEAREADARAKAEAIRDSIKAEMLAREVDEIAGNDFKVTWKNIETTRLDVKALKISMPSVFYQYATTVESRRFRVS